MQTGDQIEFYLFKQRLLHLQLYIFKFISSINSLLGVASSPIHKHDRARTLPSSRSQKRIASILSYLILLLHWLVSRQKSGNPFKNIKRFFLKPYGENREHFNIALRTDIQYIANFIVPLETLIGGSRLNCIFELIFLW